MRRDSIPEDSLSGDSLEKRSYERSSVMTGKDSTDGQSSIRNTCKKVQSRKIAGHQGHLPLSFSISIFATPEYTHRTLSGKNSKSIRLSRNTYEGPLPALTKGISINCMRGSLFMRGMLSDGQYGERGKYTHYYKPYLFRPPRRDTTISYRTTYHYVEGSLLIGIRTTGRLYLAVTTGISFNFYRSMKTDYLMDPDTPREYNPFLEEGAYRDFLDPRNCSYRKLTTALIVQAEAGFELNKRWALHISPSFQHFLSSIYKNNLQLQSRPYALGVSIGGSYTFGANR